MLIPLYILYEIKKELASPKERKEFKRKEEQFLNKFLGKKRFNIRF